QCVIQAQACRQDQRDQMEQVELHPHAAPDRARIAADGADHGADPGDPARHGGGAQPVPSDRADPGGRPGPGLRI
ncbi:hypothetical protein XarbCFBP8150_21465, partial [Xanthomonas arboricola]